MDAVALQAMEGNLHWLFQNERKLCPELQAAHVTYRLWTRLAPLIKEVPHLYVYACGRSLSLAFIGGNLMPEGELMPTASRVSFFGPLPIRNPEADVWGTGP